MKNAKLNRMVAALLLALMGVLFLEPAVMAAFVSSFNQGISVRATPAEQVWTVNGSFNESNWASNGNSGLSVTNKTTYKDIWVYFEYTGDLKQVFKHSDPIKVGPGATVAVPLLPLDDKDSPRILNPLDLVQTSATVPSGTGKSCSLNLSWRYFKGTVKIHMLNEYATAESNQISISGKTLWCVYFAKKFGLDPNYYYKLYWPVEPLCEDKDGKHDDHDCSFGIGGVDGAALDVVAVNPVTAAPAEADLNTRSAQALADSTKLVTELTQYKPLEFILPVMQAVEQIAPGLLKERSYFLESLQKLINEVQSLAQIINELQSEVSSLKEDLAKKAVELDQLKTQLAQDEAMILNLNSQIQERDARIIQLEQQVQSSVQAPAYVSAPSATVSPVVTNSGPESPAASPENAAPAPDSGTAVVEPASPASSPETAPVDPGTAAPSSEASPSVSEMSGTASDTGTASAPSGTASDAAAPGDAATN